MSDIAASSWSRAGPRRDSRAPALVAAAALHAVLIAFLALGHPKSPLPLGAAVPITLLASDPLTDSRPAEAAPEVQSARTEAPAPAAKPPLPAAASPPPRSMRQPAPARLSAPLAPAAKPTPMRPTPRPQAVAAAKPTASAKSRPSKAFSLDALQADIAKAARAQPARPALAARGPARAETAPRARPDAGQGVSQQVSASDLQGLQQLLERLWNPNCDVPGGDAVVVPVHFQVGEDGRLLGRAVDIRPDAKPVVAAAARRALDAVYEAEPFAEAYRGKSITVNFDAHKYCASR